MNHEKNFIPLNQRPKSVQREIQKMGVDASRKIRAERIQKRKTLQQIVGDVLYTPIKLPELKKMVDEMNIYKGDKNKNNLLALVVSVFMTGIEKGDIKVLKDLIELSGEKSVEKIDTISHDKSVLEIQEYLALKKSLKKDGQAEQL